MPQSEKENIRKVAYCPHCCNKAPQRLLHTQTYIRRIWGHAGQELVRPGGTFVAECETCNQILLYDSPGGDTEEEFVEFVERNLIFPDTGIDVSVPIPIARIYLEAKRIMWLAPNAFAGQIRRALEALCEDRGAKKGSLQVRLSHLADQGEIPDVLAEASDVLRLVGNTGAHASSDPVHPMLASAIDELFLAIVEYVYVAPRKLDDFRERLKQYSNKE